MGILKSNLSTSQTPSLALLFLDPILSHPKVVSIHFQGDRHLIGFSEILKTSFLSKVAAKPIGH
jgi:hypothetical protein